jgi:hypothetical protein
VRRRLTNVGLIKKPEGWKESDFKLLSEGMALCKSTQTVNGIHKLILGNALEEACTYAAEYLTGTLKMPSIDSYLDCIKVIELL